MNFRQSGWINGGPRCWAIDGEDCCIEPSQIARYLGQGKPREWEVSPQLAPIILELLAEARTLVEPKVEFRFAAATLSENRSKMLLPELNSALAVGRFVSAQLRGIEAAVVFVLTIGTRLERASRARFSEGQLLEGYVFDAVGSMLVEAAAEAFERRLELEFAELDWRLTNRFSPGYCTWPTSDQPALFGLFGGNPAGVRLSESCLMSPIKSISGIMGVGPHVIRRNYPCEFCSMKSCRQRLLDRMQCECEKVRSTHPLGTEDLGLGTK